MAKMRRILASALLTTVAFSGMAQDSDNVGMSPAIPALEVPKLEIAKELKTYNFNTPKPTFDYYPEALTRDIAPDHTYLRDFSGHGTIASWNSGKVSASASLIALPGFMGMESGRFSITQRVGNFTLSGSASAEKYGFFRRLDTTFGIHGSLTYHINDDLSLTAFGSRYSNSVFHSPAAMPYINQSAFGGYMSINVVDEIVGIDLGVQRTVNPWTGLYETVPITRLNIMGFGIDAGYLLKELVFDKIFDNTSKNPSMGPPRPHIPIAPRR